MTEWTKERIEAERKLSIGISPMPWLDCGWNWIERNPNKYEAWCEGPAVAGKHFRDVEPTATKDMDFMRSAVNNYLSALDEISRLQSALKEAEEDAERKQAVLDGTGFSFFEDEQYSCLCLRGHGTIYIPVPRVELHQKRIRKEEKMTDREKIEQIIVNTLLKDSEIEQDPPEETNDDELPY
jgi:hypothetical protein